MRCRLAGLVLLCAVITAGCGAGPLPAHPHVAHAQAVRATAASEDGPAFAGGVLAWMRSARPDRVPPHTASDVFVRANGVTVRVNPQGTYAQTGGIDGGSLVLAIVRSGHSRLARYDLGTRRLRYLPRAINDGAWLWRPDADAGRILYGAIVPGKVAQLAYEIRLADLGTGKVRVLARLDGHAEYAAPGQLRGDWATWVACPESTCNVWRQNLAHGEAESAPDPDHLSYTQIAPAVDRRGVVYFDRIAVECGHAEIRRWGRTADSLVVSLPAHFAYQYGYLTRAGRTLYFDLGPCKPPGGDDIYALRVAP